MSLVLGVTGLVTTDDKNARNIDVDLWAMTNQETGEYGVSGLDVSICCRDTNCADKLLCCCKILRRLID